MRKFLGKFCVGLVALFQLWTASAQTTAQNTAVAKAVSYEGADRQQHLIAEAKKEGSLTLYTSITPANLDVLKTDFEKKYGVKVIVWRAGDDKVVQRVLTEAKAGRAGVDLVHVNTLEMEQLHRENMLQKLKSPFANALIPSAVPPHGSWVATFMNPVVVSYNTDKVTKSELPKTYQDLLDPIWKGRLGIEANDQEWFSAVAKEMGTEKGLKFFKDLVATNGLSVRSGHSLLNNMVISGDVPMGLTVYGHMPLLAKQKGAHIDWFTLEPVVALSFGAGLSRTAPRPNAALLFYEYLITDGQKLLSQMHYVPTNKNTDSEFKNLSLKVVDKAVFLDEYQKWTTLYQDIVLRAK
jgi:iron(III) transport system substrate-binding protein